VTASGEAPPRAPGGPSMAIDPAELARALSGLVPSAEPAPDVISSLQRAVAATRDLFRVTGAGLMLVDEENVLRYAVASDATARLLEIAQEDLGEGPSVDAFLEGRMVETADIARDDRWPGLTPLAAERGVCAALGIPTRLNGELIGSLDVFVNEPHEWDESERRALEAFNEVIEGILLDAVTAQRQAELVAQLQYALDNRLVIERAVGLLMGRDGLDQPEAFNRLRQTARSSGRKVGDVARELLGGDGVLGAGEPRERT
jgi:GAF domain-containing protein